MNKLECWTLVISVLLGAVGCGDAGGSGGVPTDDRPATAADRPATADTAAAPPASAGCTSACARISECAAMSGESVDAASCRNECAMSAPSPACFGCFSGPCASSCGDTCASCFFNNCAALVAPPPADAGAPPPPPPPADAGAPPSDPVCGTNTLHPDIGRNCQGDSICGTAVCNFATRNALTRYCTQACSTIADCPCSGGSWSCALISGRSAVQRYCVAAGR